MVTVSIDGKVIAAEKASISVLDRGLLYGDGLFEVLRTWQGRALELEAHLDRLYASAKVLQLRAMDRTKLMQAVQRTIAAAPPGDHKVRIVLTRGPGALGDRFAALGPGKAIVIVEPLPAQPTGLSLAVVEWPLAQRTAGHKTLAYLDQVIARELAAAADADEAVRLDADGAVAECATANLFVVADGEVVTPPVDTGALPGVTRARVLEVCEAAGISVGVRKLPLRELRVADEIFATSALRGVVPITRLDGVPVAAGPVTARIAEAYAQAMRALL